MKIIGVIPARGGSKGIPRKNITLLGGRPLISYTIEAAKKAKVIDRVIVSTDDEEIQVVSQQWGAEAPFLRPHMISGDEAKSVDVAKHLIEWLEKQEGWRPDAVALLQPTSPLRDETWIQRGVGLMLEHDADTVVSVVKVNHRYHPKSLMLLRDGLLCAMEGGLGEIGVCPRQQFEDLYARNGPAVLIAKTNVIKGRNTFYGNKILPLVMDQRASVDIDSLEDIKFAEALLRNFSK